jgi:hypothetical protein
MATNARNGLLVPFDATRHPAANAAAAICSIGAPPRCVLNPGMQQFLCGGGAARAQPLEMYEQLHPTRGSAGIPEYLKLQVFTNPGQPSFTSVTVRKLTKRGDVNALFDKPCPYPVAISAVAKSDSQKEEQYRLVNGIHVDYPLSEIATFLSGCVTCVRR